MWSSHKIALLLLSYVFQPHTSLAHPSKLGLSVRQTVPVPSTPGNEVSIYIAPTECKILMRMQEIQGGQSAQDARVVRLQWNDDSGTVTRTVMSFNNALGTNAQLWNQLNLKSLLYYGLVGARGTVSVSELGAVESWISQTMTPQYNLMGNDDNPITLILPNAIKGKFSPNGLELHTMNEYEEGVTADQIMKGKSFVGISGTLSPENYAYSDRRAFLKALREFTLPYEQRSNPEESRFMDSWVGKQVVIINAERGNGQPVTIALDPRAY